MCRRCCTGGSRRSNPWPAMYGTVRVQLDTKSFVGRHNAPGRCCFSRGTKFFLDAKNFLGDTNSFWWDTFWKDAEPSFGMPKVFSAYKMFLHGRSGKGFLGAGFWRGGRGGGSGGGGGGDTRQTSCFNLDLRRRLPSADLSGRTDRADPQSAPKREIFNSHAKPTQNPRRRTTLPQNFSLSPAPLPTLFPFCECL